MLDKKAVLTREKINTLCLTKKNFSEELLRQLFLINSNNQELLHHIHCFGRIYLIIKARQRNLVDFIIYYFMILTGIAFIECLKHFLFNKTSLYSL